MSSPQALEVDFTTLGMFIIDEIHFPPPQAPVYNIIGGAGSYAALGARIFSPAPELSRRVGWIVDKGEDFPDEVRQTISSWNTSCRIRDTPERLTTRGWNGYVGTDETRAFRYTTPKLRLDHDSLDDNLLRSKTFHLICSPARCMDMVKSILAKRRALGPPVSDPLFIWEPVPDLCVPEELEACYEALNHVQIVSPNHAELCGFFGVAPHEKDGNVAIGAIEACCRQWLTSGIGNNSKGAIVVRAGKTGCYVATRDRTRWISAYHQNSDCVKDPTGGGNAFLGGLGIGVARGEMEAGFATLVKAAIYGSVSASFAIEQVGVPGFARTDAGETWNGARVNDRVMEMMQRLQLPE